MQQICIGLSRGMDLHHLSKSDQIKEAHQPYSATFIPRAGFTVPSQPLSLSPKLSPALVPPLVPDTYHTDPVALGHHCPSTVIPWPHQWHRDKPPLPETPATGFPTAPNSVPPTTAPHPLYKHLPAGNEPICPTQKHSQTSVATQTPV